MLRVQIKFPAHLIRLKIDPVSSRVLTTDCQSLGSLWEAIIFKMKTAGKGRIDIFQTIGRLSFTVDGKLEVKSDRLTGQCCKEKFNCHHIYKWRHCWKVGKIILMQLISNNTIFPLLLILYIVKIELKTFIEPQNAQHWCCNLSSFWGKEI